MIADDIVTGAAGASGSPAAPRSPRPYLDASNPTLLPESSSLEMPDQDFSARPAREWAKRRGSSIPRTAVFLGAALMTAAFAHELYGVLAFVQMTPIQFLFLVLSTLTFAWISVGTLSAALGFLPLFAGENADTIAIPDADGPLEGRTALLFPVYHEDPASISGTISAIVEELVSLGKADSFDIYILSDTRGAEAGIAEEAAYAELAKAQVSLCKIYYRRRIENTGRKAGNIKDWVERFGGAYETFVILDGDSVMSGVALVRLARAMEADPSAGLIQTVPKLIGGRTLLQKLMQFAANVYGPAAAAGMAFWSKDQGNYWGHNAIIRTHAFASAAGLPHLPGPPPFGGHILSHDFVEAMLLQRVGWGVHMAPSIEGSYESMPPALTDLIVRDRRWSQGNLQHLGLMGRRGVPAMGRVHLFMGALAYIVSAIWAASLVVGLVLALQGQQLLPSYFTDAKTLFPIWPVIDPGAAMRLFLATMAVVLLPKALGLALELKRAQQARELFGMPRAVAGVVTETFYSMLFAPIMMMTQTASVMQVFLGLDSGWKAQRRDGAGMELRDAMQFHWQHMLVGVIVTIVCWETSPGLLVWMAPVVLGLVLSGPINWLTSQNAGPAMSVILSTPVDRSPSSIEIRARRHTQNWRERLSPPASPVEPQRELATAA
ncbi:glucans biosynthesis glucosyltransferase MdoH [Hyphomicrobium sp.]|uniref:glucans biosynthesis glucosyltransferase MdoH n=1 Tax=Hyphomicrobium sp. TaxID=82 RepID=UPI002E356833|nr:glucans biosynthesis glucosyltransferase MdoH [Hyphomicrobium sp.]HEX2843230.1 glucans biosynthesis glucosyltransferase MdoH [Hyphomicrobium sp.]